MNSSHNDHQFRSDGELLQRYLDSRDDWALTELISRHAALVRGICQRILGSTPDADDAFQATFLVLVCGGIGIRRPHSLAAWLYGVAQRIAIRQRKQKSRSLAPLTESSAMIDSDPLTDLANQHDIALFDAELARLPEKYRAPIVLHHLEGKTQREVAAELQLTEGAVDGLLKRGRNELRLRLARKGVIFGVTLAALQSAQAAVAAAPADPVIATTVHSILAHDPILHPEYPKTPASQLARQEMMTMGFLHVGKAVAGTGMMLALVSVTGWGMSHGSQVASQATLAGIVSTLAVSQLDEVPAAEVVGNQVVASKENAAVQIDEAAVTISGGVDVTVGGTGVELTADRVIVLNKDTKLQADHVEVNTHQNIAVFGSIPNPTDAPPPIHFKKLNPSEARIESALKEQTEVSFVGTPLPDALHFLEDLHTLKILINIRELAEDGVSDDVPINLELSGASLESTLDLMLEPHGLDYVVKNDVLQITTRNMADKDSKYRELRVYRLEQLQPLIGRVDLDDPQEAQLVNRTILDAIGVEADSKFGSLSLTNAGLIVRANQRVHRELEHFFDQLRRATEEK